MLEPSYAELIDVLNKDTYENNEITSRYTIVIAAAKRARQIIDGDEPMVLDHKGKPLSTAVDEMFNNKIKIVPENQGTLIKLKKEKMLAMQKMNLNNNDFHINSAENVEEDLYTSTESMEEDLYNSIENTDNYDDDSINMYINNYTSTDENTELF